METVTIQVATAGTDDYNNPTLDWADPTETSVPGCLLAPRSTDDLDGGQAARFDATLYAPTGTTIGAQDRIVVRGTVYEVVGDPMDWTPGYGRHGGVEVRVARVVGADVEAGS